MNEPKLNPETSYDLATLKDVNIEDMLKTEPKRMSEHELIDMRFETIVESVLARYNFHEVTRKRLFAYGRKQEVIFCRHMVMYLTRELTEMGPSAIGRRFNGKNEGSTLDHSTVINAVKKIGYRIDVEKGFKEKLETFREEVKCKLNLLK